MKMKRIILSAAGLLAVGSLELAAQTNGPTENLDWGSLDTFATTNLGLSTTKAWYRELTPGRANDQSAWKQLLWFKNDGRTTQKSYFACADFNAGTVTQLSTMVPSYEPWDSKWVGGKYYMGMNLPARLTIFNPTNDALTDLGSCFASNSMTVYRIAVAPDGVLALGGGTGSDVSLYDPATNGFTHFGQAATEPGGGTYAYYLSIDSNYVYVAVRSSSPWELVRLHRTTKARTVLLTSESSYDWLTINGNAVEYTPDGEAKRYFYLDNGQLIECTATNRPPNWVLPGPGFTGTAPAMAIDQSPVYNGTNALTLYLQDPANTNSWTQTNQPIVPDTAGIEQIAALDDGRIAGLPHAYFAMVMVNLTNGATQRVPLDNVSAYGLIGASNRVFIGGYPSARVLAVNPTNALTYIESIPGRPGVPETNATANPRLIKVLGVETGHIAMNLTKGADGNIYFISFRERYYYGFSLAWFNPVPATNGDYAFTVFDDEGAFDHLQIASMQAVNGGSNMLIGTTVQYNPGLTSPVPASASVFLFDVAQKQIIGQYEPLTNCQRIYGATLDGPDTIIGYAQNYKTAGVTTLFRFNTSSEVTELVRHYDKTLGGLGAQPDGLLWGSALYNNATVLFTVDPKDLSAQGVGEKTNLSSYYFCHPSGIYLGGAPQLTRVLGLTPPTAPPPMILAFTTQPSANTVTGAPFARQPVVTIQYTNGETVTTGVDSRRDVTLTLTTGSGALSGTTTVTAVAGVASFAGLSINLIGADKVLTATAAATMASGPLTTNTPAFTITRGISQTITFPPIPEQGVADTVHLSATASSGLPVTNFTVASGPGTIANRTNLTFTATGIVSIVAAQAGNTNWSEAPNVTNTFAVYALSPQYNVIPWSDAFENYANNQALVYGTNGWFGSHTNIVAQSSIVFGGARAARIPACTILSNRFQNAALSSNVWVQLDLRPILCDSTNSPMAVDTNATVMFYVNSNGHFVVHNGPAAPAKWVTLTNFTVGTSGTNWVRIGVYKNYNTRTWDLYASNSVSVSNVLVTNNIGFINAGRTNFAGFDACGAMSGTRTSYLDNVAVVYTNKTLGAASQLAFTTQPSASTPAGAPFAQQPVVKILDALGNTVTNGPDSTTNVTLRLSTGAGMLLGTTNVNAVAGVASFAGLSINLAGADKVLTATAALAAGIRTTATDPAFAITVGAANKLAFTTQPSASTPAGTPFAQQPVVKIQDAWGNTVTTGTDATTNVTLTLTTGAGALAGTASVNAVAGVASFAGLSINLAGADKVLTATATLTSGVKMTNTSPAFAITAGTANRLAFTTQPSASTPAGAPFAQQPAVAIQDTNGNTVTSGTDATRSVALTLTSGSGTLSGTTNVNAIAGVASFAGLSINLAGEDKVLTATATLAAGARTTYTTPAFAITAGTANRLAFTTQPSANTMTSTPFARQPVVTIQDTNGNTVTTGADATRSVALTLTSGSGALSGTTNVNAIAGVASFAGLSINLIGADKVLTATATLAAGGRTTNTAPAFTITRGISQTITFPPIPDQGVADTVRLSAASSSGLPVTNFTVASGPGTIANRTNLTFTATGIVSIVAAQAGNTNWSEAPSVTNTFAVYTLSPKYSTIPFSDTFEVYANNKSLVYGTNGWFGSHTGIVAQSSIVFGGARAARIPACTILSNRFQNAALPSNVWVQMDLRPILCDRTNSPMAVDTNATVMFYVNSNGHFVVHNGPATPVNWVTLTNFAVGTNGTNWVKVGVYENYNTRTWELYASNSVYGNVLVTNNIGFVNAGRTNFAGFDACGAMSGTRTSYLDNVAVIYSNRPAGAASKLAFTMQPSESTVTNVVFTRQPVVKILDANGNTVTTGADATRSVALALTTGSGALSGTTNVNAVAGVATFSGLKINLTGTDKVLTATATLTSGVKTTNTAPAFAITDGGMGFARPAPDTGAASKLAFTTLPSASTPAGQAFARQPVVAIQDAWGNTVTTGDDATRVVTLTLSAGKGVLLGTTQAKAVAGVASFAGLSINLTGADKVLTATVTLGAGVRTMSSPAFAITAQDQFALESPSVSASRGLPREVRVTWSVSPGATRYALWKNTVNESSSAQPLPVSGLATVYRDMAVLPGPRYYYWVKALNSLGDSGMGAASVGWCSAAKWDFNGDGRAEAWYYHEASGRWYVMLPSNTLSTALLGGAGWAAAPADYDGDGKTDPAVYNRGATSSPQADSELGGTWQILFSGHGYELGTFPGFGGAGYAVAVGDYDGDGLTDPAIYAEASGTWQVAMSQNGYQVAIVTGLGSPGYQAAPADYDGDGKTDPAVYAEASGNWLIWLSGDGYNVSYVPQFGLSGYVPVPGEYNGQGYAQIAVYHQESGNWHVRTGPGLEDYTTEHFGRPGYLPMPADYDGDRRADPGVLYWNAPDGIWYLLMSTEGFRMIPARE